MILFLFYSCGFGQNSLRDCTEASDPAFCLQTRISSTNTPLELLDQCADITEEKWRGECYFAISDQSGLMGDSARSICERAKPFDEDCLRHAAARDVELNLFPQLINSQAKPLKVMPRIYSILSTYLPDEIAQPMARDMILRKTAKETTAPFSITSCRGLKMDLCSQLYILASLGDNRQWTGEEQFFSYCEQEFTPALAQEFSWLDYRADAKAIVQRAFRQVCQAKPEAN